MVLNPKGPAWDLVILEYLRCHFLSVTEWMGGWVSWLCLWNTLPCSYWFKLILEFTVCFLLVFIVMKGESMSQKQLSLVFQGHSVFAVNKQISGPSPALFEDREHTLQFSVTVAIFKVVWKFLKSNEPNEVIKAGYTDTRQNQQSLGRNDMN